MKKLFVAFIVFTLLVGCVYAANVNDFKVDEKLYNSTFTLSDGVIYFDNTNSSGVGIFKYIDADDNSDNDDAIDNIIMDDGSDYLQADDDFKLNKNPDNTANFTDVDHNNQGIVELVDVDNERFVIVFWSKEANATNELMSELTDFNKDNNLTPIAF